MKTFGLHPYTQNGESVPLGDSQAVTNADNHSASLGINSPECSASKGTTFFSYSKKYKRKQALQNPNTPGRMYNRMCIFKKVYNRHTTVNQSAEIDERSLDVELGGTPASTRMLSPTPNFLLMAKVQDYSITTKKTPQFIHLSWYFVRKIVSLPSEIREEFSLVMTAPLDWS